MRFIRGSTRGSQMCVCGHGTYNHGGGHTAIGRILGQNSRCIRCGCMEFRRAPEIFRQRETRNEEQG